MNAPQKPMRLAMPTVASWIDELREAFGADQINPSLKAGMQGGSDFHATENGHEIGIPYQPGARPAEPRSCRTCAHRSHWPLLGKEPGYCGGRGDLPPAYGPNHPLRRLPADRGATCANYRHYSHEE